MKQIYLSGYYGQNNLGDDYIFYSVLDQLSGLNESVVVNVEIGNHKFDEQIYQSIAELYDNIKLKFTYSHGLKGKFDKILSIMRSDYFIVGGGGLFPAENINVLKHLDTYFYFAKLVGTKTCLYGIDIDSLQNSHCNEIWCKIISHVDFLETRNDLCSQELRIVVGNKNNIYSGVDLTHAFRTKEESEDKKELFLGKYGLKNTYMIWALAMPWSQLELQDNHFHKRYKRLCHQIQELICEYDSYQHIFLPYFEGTDILMIQDVLSGIHVDSIIIHDCPLGEKRLFFKYAEQAVVMRFHGVQFALYHATPFIAISYSPKISNILNEIGLPDLFVEYGIRDNSCFMKEFDITDNEWNNWKINLGTNKEKITAASDQLKIVASDRKKSFLQWLKSGKWE